ncbi:MAG: ATP-binding protein [Bacteroidia bacterium]
MNKNLLPLLMLAAVALWACGGSKAPADEQAQDTAPAAPAEPAKSGRALQLKDIGLASPESVIGDGTYYYVSNVGKKLEPSNKDGDGFIMKLDFDGNVVAEKFMTGLDAPKGSAIAGGKFYVADIDKVRIFDLATGEAAGEIDFSKTGTQFLNDIAKKSETELFVSATDINRIYTIKLADGSYTELVAKPTIQKPNGLWYEAANNTLYVVNFTDDMKGVVGKIVISNAGNTYETLNPFEGGLDGIALLNEQQLVFTDWNRKAFLLLDLSSGRVGQFPIAEEVKAKGIDGPADFFFDAAKGEFWIPGMRENTITIQTLP